MSKGDKKKRSQKQEKKIAKAVDGKVTPASGAIPFWKNDVHSEYWHIEAKYTDKNSYAINKKMLDTLTKEAQKNWKLPSLVVEFSPREIYVVIRWEDWLHYDSLLKEENG